MCDWLKCHLHMRLELSNNEFILMDHIASLKTVKYTHLIKVKSENHIFMLLVRSLANEDLTEPQRYILLAK